MWVPADILSESNGKDIADLTTLPERRNLRRRQGGFPTWPPKIKNGLSQMALAEILLYSKPGCCLCERAKEHLKTLQAHHEFIVREINILEDQAVYKMFKDEIPVIFVNGKKAFKYHLDEDKFVRILEFAYHKQCEENKSTP